MARALCLIALLPSLGGCQPDFDPASYVTGLRVLAIRAEPPEVAPGEPSTLTVLAFDTRSRPIQLDWAICSLAPVPGSTAITNPDCVKQDTADYLTPIGSGNPITVAMPSRDVSLADLRAGRPTALGYPDSTDGLYVPIRLRATAGTEVVTAVYRLRFHIPGLPIPRNRNPAFDGLLRVDNSQSGGTRDSGVPSRDSGGEPDAATSMPPDAGEPDAAASPPMDAGTDDSGAQFALCSPPTPDAATPQNPDGGAMLTPFDETLEPVIHPMDSITLRATAKPGSAELYPVLTADPRDPRNPTACLNREIPRVFWFSTAGTFNAIVTAPGADNSFTADKHLPPDNPPDGAIIDLFAVLREERGGIDFLHRRLRLR